MKLQKKYLKSFTIYVEDNQLYEKDIAVKIEKSLQSLKNKKILEIRTFNSDVPNVTSNHFILLIEDALKCFDKSLKLKGSFLQVYLLH